MTVKKSIGLLIAILFFTTQVRAQDWKSEKKINLVFGLTQPLLLQGFNIEGNYIHKRLIFDYSHGVSLDFYGNALTRELKKQKVAVHIPYTTGFGIGYRFTNWLNVRIEPKWHRFEIYYEHEPQTSTNEITSYNTFTLGLGAYGHFQPFKSNTSFLKGIMISPSLRFWPTVCSTLKGDHYSYVNKNTSANEEITTLGPGIGFSSIIFNVSVGYSFAFAK